MPLNPNATKDATIGGVVACEPSDLDARVRPASFTLSIADTDMDGEGCVRVRVNTDAPAKDADAVADLICAAPDLLATCRSVVILIEGLESIPAGTTDAIRDRLRAAIAKAH